MHDDLLSFPGDKRGTTVELASGHGLRGNVHERAFRTNAVFNAQNGRS